jgi:hypothetical protein
MRKPRPIRASTATALAVILVGHLSVVAAGVLLCVGEGTDPGCCGGPGAGGEWAAGPSGRLLAGEDCSCCIAFDASRSTASVGITKASLHPPASRLEGTSAAPQGLRSGPPPPGDGGRSPSSSFLSTVVLLI